MLLREHHIGFMTINISAETLTMGGENGPIDRLGDRSRRGWQGDGNPIKTFSRGSQLT